MVEFVKNMNLSAFSLLTLGRGHVSKVNFVDEFGGSLLVLQLIAFGFLWLDV